MTKRSRRRQGPLALRIAEGALLTVPFIFLAYQSIRFEGFLIEKTSLVGLAATLILGATIAHIFEARELPGWDWSFMRRNPLIIAVGVLLIVMVLSTAFSLSFTRSFWGNAERSWGLYVFLAFMIIFLQSIRSTGRLQRFLPVALPLIVLVVALTSILPFYGLELGFNLDTAFRTRPTGTAGNPNWLSAWLAMAFLYLLGFVVSKIATWEKPLVHDDFGFLAVYGVTFILIIWTLALTLSRGALLGLLAGLILCVLLVAVKLNNRVLVGAMAAFGVVVVGVYVGLNQYFQANPLPENPSTIAAEVRRFSRPYDEARVALWENGIDYFTLQAEPVTRLDGSPDPLHALRPVIGYGADVLEQVEPLGIIDRQQLRVSEGQYVDRLHNLNQDVFLMHGWAGLLATLAVYETALYLGLSTLGILNKRNLWLWALAQIAGATLFAIVLNVIAPEVGFGVTAPLGVTAGLIAGTAVIVGVGVLLPTEEDAAPFVLDQRNATIIALMGVIVAHWIDNQFGFMQSTAQPLFWILMGVLVVLTAEDPPTEEEQALSEEPSPWVTAGTLAGLFAIFTFGASIDSAVITVRSGDGTFLLIVLAALLVMASLGWTFDEDSDLSLGVFGTMWVVPSMWVGFFIVETILRAIVSDTLTRMLTNEALRTVSTMQTSFIFLGFTGVALMLFAVGAGTNQRSAAGMSSGQAAILAFAVLIGGGVYATRYAGTALHRTANVLRDVQTADAFTIAELAYSAAEAYMPNSSRIRLDHMNLTVQIGVATDNIAGAEEQINESLADILQTEPYFTESREWQLYYDAYSEFIDFYVLQ